MQAMSWTRGCPSPAARSRPCSAASHLCALQVAVFVIITMMMIIVIVFPARMIACACSGVSPIESSLCQEALSGGVGARGVVPSSGDAVT